MIVFLKTVCTRLATICLFVIPCGTLSAQLGYEEPEPPPIVKKIPTTPSIKGASPENGASDLIRNVLISARMDLLDRYQGVDAKSVSEKSIRLYPANNPNKPVGVFITVNNGLKNILLEPEEVLEPNTEYVFEINSLLVDLEGVPFEVFKSSFKTGTRELPKRINKNKPRVKVIPARKRIKLNTLPEGYLIKKEKPKAEPKPEPVVAEKKSEEEVFDRNLSPQELKKAKLEAAIAAKLAKYNEEREGTTVSSPATKPSVSTPTPAVVSESHAEKSQPELVKEVAANTAVDTTVVVAEKRDNPLPLKAKIEYKVQAVRKDKALPVSFSMPEQVQIRYMIKNAAGEIVKKGKGTVEAGTANKSIPMKGLAPGKYKIAIKAGSLVQNHLFTILQ